MHHLRRALLLATESSESVSSSDTPPSLTCRGLLPPLVLATGIEDAGMFPSLGGAAHSRLAASSLALFFPSICDTAWNGPYGRSENFCFRDLT